MRTNFNTNRRSLVHIHLKFNCFYPQSFEWTLLKDWHLILFLSNVRNNYICTGMQIYMCSACSFFGGHKRDLIILRIVPTQTSTCKQLLLFFNTHPWLDSQLFVNVYKNSTPIHSSYYSKKKSSCTIISKFKMYFGHRLNQNNLIKKLLIVVLVRK